LVPSRYALRVGEIDVFVVSDGVLPFKTPALATNADPAVRESWLSDMFLPRDEMVWPLNVVVVRSGGRTILIDSGLGVEYPDFARTGRLDLRLEAAGIDLASVTDVVLTHMHLDHVGGLLVDGVKDRLRPDVPIHAAAAEAKFWVSPDFSRSTSMPAWFPVYRPRFPGHRVDGNRVGRSRRGDSEIAAPLEIVDPEPIVELFFEAPSPQAAFRGRCWARTAAGV
jgi:glyoxylase-like metal-dependent hydrolase (beta-lactamase superfamily II)